MALAQPQPAVSFTNTTPTPPGAPRCIDLTTKAAPATSSSDLHLRLNGIQGDSITKLHPNEIDATGFCFAGGGTGKFGSFTVQKLYDKSVRAADEGDDATARRSATAR